MKFIFFACIVFILLVMFSNNGLKDQENSARVIKTTVRGRWTQKVDDVRWEGDGESVETQSEEEEIITSVKGNFSNPFVSTLEFEGGSREKDGEIILKSKGTVKSGTVQFYNLEYYPEDSSVQNSYNEENLLMGE